MIFEKMLLTSFCQDDYGILNLIHRTKWTAWVYIFYFNPLLGGKYKIVKWGKMKKGEKQGKRRLKRRKKGEKEEKKGKKVKKGKIREDMEK